MTTHNPCRCLPTTPHGTMSTYVLLKTKQKTINIIQCAKLSPSKHLQHTDSKCQHLTAKFVKICFLGQTKCKKFFTIFTTVATVESISVDVVNGRRCCSMPKSLFDLHAWILCLQLRLLGLVLAVQSLCLYPLNLGHHTKHRHITGK